MDEKFNDATSNRPMGGRTLDAPMVTINLSLHIAQIREEEQWKNSDRNAITIFKSMVMRIVLIALHKGAEMKKHTAAGTISLQVIEGEIMFTTDEQSTSGIGKIEQLNHRINFVFKQAKAEMKAAN